MAFSKAMPEAFHVILFNGSHDNEEAKSHAYLYAELSAAQLLAKQLCVVLLCPVYTCKILHAVQHCTSLQSAII